jgi:hypothetical protein
MKLPTGGNTEHQFYLGTADFQVGDTLAVIRGRDVTSNLISESRWNDTGLNLSQNPGSFTRLRSTWLSTFLAPIR